MTIHLTLVIPAKAGIQDPQSPTLALDPRFRGGDGYFGSAS
jgi:hypothetical protein